MSRKKLNELIAKKNYEFLPVKMSIQCVTFLLWTDSQSNHHSKNDDGCTCYHNPLHAENIVFWNNIRKQDYKDTKISKKQVVTSQTHADISKQFVVKGRSNLGLQRLMVKCIGAIFFPVVACDNSDNFPRVYSNASDKKWIFPSTKKPSIVHDSFLDIGFEVPDRFVVGYAIVSVFLFCLHWKKLIHTI